MPKYFCDYCDTYLTHDSPSVRKTHCQGRKHKENVKYYYQKWMEEQTQNIIDRTTAAFKAGKGPYPPGAAIPPPGALPGGPQVPPRPPGPMPPARPGPGLMGNPPGAGPMPPMMPIPGPPMPMPGMRPPMGPMGPMMMGMPGVRPPMPMPVQGPLRK